MLAQARDSGRRRGALTGIHTQVGRNALELLLLRVELRLGLLAVAVGSPGARWEEGARGTAWAQHGRIALGLRCAGNGQSGREHVQGAAPAGGPRRQPQAGPAPAAGRVACTTLSSAPGAPRCQLAGPALTPRR